MCAPARRCGNRLSEPTTRDSQADGTQGPGAGDRPDFLPGESRNVARAMVFTYGVGVGAVLVLLLAVLSLKAF